MYNFRLHNLRPFLKWNSNRFLKKLVWFVYIFKFGMKAAFQRHSSTFFLASKLVISILKILFHSLDIFLQKDEPMQVILTTLNVNWQNLLQYNWTQFWEVQVYHISFHILQAFVSLKFKNLRNYRKEYIMEIIQIFYLWYY